MRIAKNGAAPSAACIAEIFGSRGFRTNIARSIRGMYNAKNRLNVVLRNFNF